MKKGLFVSLLFLLKISATNAQSVGTDLTNNISNVLADELKLVQQIKTIRIKEEKTLSKRRNKGKNKRKSKIGIIYINFAEHNFQVFTC